jgi:hypothetical protein
MNDQRLLYDTLEASLQQRQPSDPGTRDYLVAYLQRQRSAIHDEWRRLPSQMFWPPRVVNGVRHDSVNIFFGSGISLASGIPDWTGLLRQVGLDAEVERDPSASGDLLTLAELAAHAVGADPLQAAIRLALSHPKRSPTTAHFLLAALHLPLYLTTNYDGLFESAVEEIFGFSPVVVTNDLNVKSFFGDSSTDWDRALAGNAHPCCAVKLHGSLARGGEHLILTRSDYRRHYRSNPLMLDFVRHVLGTRHTLFLGFSHRDPEVARIIEDVIFGAEIKRPQATIPGFYSLQFDMLQKTPEVFAARGIVALQPPLVFSTMSGGDARGCSLAQGLVDLAENAEHKMDEALSLDEDLRRVASSVKLELEDIVDRLVALNPDALNAVRDSGKTLRTALTDRIVADFGEFANQGAYLVGQHGNLLATSCPNGLDAAQRMILLKNVQNRPYFRLAQSNRRPFVSDLFESVFNGNATLAACLPLLDADRFVGLVLVVFQLHSLGFVSRLRAIPVPVGASLLVTDANGLLVIPPEKEVSTRVPSQAELRIKAEDPAKNEGYPYAAILQVSRRDKRIDRLMQNVVPLAQDDDVHVLAPDIVSYSVVTELAEARWKIALSRYLRTRI